MCSEVLAKVLDCSDIAWFLKYVWGGDFHSHEAKEAIGRIKAYTELMDREFDTFGNLLVSHNELMAVILRYRREYAKAEDTTCQGA